MDKLKAAWAWSAKWAAKGWTFVNTFSNGPLLALIALVVVVVLLSRCASAAVGVAPTDAEAAHGRPAPLVMPDDDVRAIATNRSDVNLFCKIAAEPDGLHLCQAWVLLSPTTGSPISEAVWCFVKAVHPRPGGGLNKLQWQCNRDRAEVKRLYDVNPALYESQRPPGRNEIEA